MGEIDCAAEKDDFLDVGPMPDYDDANKPECLRCNTKTFVMSVGRDHKWKWKCTNCQTCPDERPSGEK